MLEEKESARRQRDAEAIKAQVTHCSRHSSRLSRHMQAARTELTVSQAEARRQADMQAKAAAAEGATPISVLI